MKASKEEYGRKLRGKPLAIFGLEHSRPGFPLHEALAEQSAHSPIARLYSQVSRHGSPIVARSTRSLSRRYFFAHVFHKPRPYPLERLAAPRRGQRCRRPAATIAEPSYPSLILVRRRAALGVGVVCSFLVARRLGLGPARWTCLSNPPLSVRGLARCHTYERSE